MYKEYLQKLENLKGTERIELGLIEDYNSRIDKANDARSVASQNYSKALGGMETATKHLELAVKVAVEVEKAAKDIGVKSPIDLKKAQAKLSDFKKVVNVLKSGKIGR